MIKRIIDRIRFALLPAFQAEEMGFQTMEEAFEAICEERDAEGGMG